MPPSKPAKRRFAGHPEKFAATAESLPILDTHGEDVAKT